MVAGWSFFLILNDHRRSRIPLERIPKGMRRIGDTTPIVHLRRSFGPTRPMHRTTSLSTSLREKALLAWRHGRALLRGQPGHPPALSQGRDGGPGFISIRPSNSAQTYHNAFFTKKDGTDAARASRSRAFEDTWHWNVESERTCGEDPRDATGQGQRSDAGAFAPFSVKTTRWLTCAMMAPRLVELRRVLKSTGSLYLHCDPTASHYRRVAIGRCTGRGEFQKRDYCGNGRRPKASPFAAPPK